MIQFHRDRLLFWAPRALCILFAVFVSLFALDVFSEHYSVGETVQALLIHLIPTFIILAILALSWRWEAVAGILLVGIGAAYIATNQAHWDWCLAIGGPAVVTGFLFLIDWKYRSVRHARP